jgi:hypothetical protein
MDDRRKCHGRGRTNTPRRAIFADQLGKAGLYRIVAALQGVILGVRNRRPIFTVIKLVIAGDHARQALKLGGGVLDRQGIDGGCFGRHAVLLQGIWTCFRAKSKD